MDISDIMGDLPIFVTYEYNGVIYRQKSIEFGVFLFHSRIKPYIIAPVNEAKVERLVAIRYSALKNCDIFILAGVGSFFNRRF